MRFQMRPWFAVLFIFIGLPMAAYIAACADGTGSKLEEKKVVERNFAEEYVLARDPDAKCTRQYTDVGEDHVHSVDCRLSADKSYVAIVWSLKGLQVYPQARPATPEGQQAPEQKSEPEQGKKPQSQGKEQRK